MTLLTRLRDGLLERPAVYAAWQAPFRTAKVRPFVAYLGTARPKRVLDVGCGPGTNVELFDGCEYVGVDINPRYITTARARFRRRFEVADVTDPRALPDERFDCIFLNSLMHHLDDAAVERLLGSLRRLTTPSGRVHILDLVLPERRSMAYLLARADRGRFARPLAAWRALLEPHWALDHWAPYALGLPGLPLWQMLYAVGMPR